MESQAVVLIDNGYLAKTLENDFGRTRLDYSAFAHELGRLTEFVDHETGRMVTRQKGVDVMLAVDMIDHTLDPEMEVDNMILIAGDADFEPAVRYSVSRGKNIVLCCSTKYRKNGGKSYSDALMNVSSSFISLDYDLISKCSFVRKKAESLKSHS